MQILGQNTGNITSQRTYIHRELGADSLRQRAHASQLLGMGRHDWGTIHTWVGVALLLLLILHVAFHWKTIDAFFHKNLPNRGVRTAVVGLLTLFALMAILP